MLESESIVLIVLKPVYLNILPILFVQYYIQEVYMVDSDMVSYSVGLFSIDHNWMVAVAT